MKKRHEALGNDPQSHASQENEVRRDCLDLLAKIDSMINSPTILEVCGKQKKENVHTSILCYLFGCKEFSLGQPSGLTRLCDLILEVNLSQNIIADTSALMPLSNGNLNIHCEKEVSLSRDSRIDLCLTLEAQNDKTVTIWIENKINSNPHYDQLSRYYEEIRKNANANEENVFVYLSPSHENKPDHDGFIHITYQNLYDKVLHPLLRAYDKDESHFGYLLHEYCHTLTSLYHNMNPIVKAENYTEAKESLLRVYKQYKEVFELAIMEHGTDEEKEAIQSFTKDYMVEYKGKKVEVKGFTSLAVTIFKLLLKEGYPREVLLLNLGQIDKSFGLTGIDLRVAAERGIIEDKKFSPTRIGSKIMVSNQWSGKKIQYFIELLKRYYPDIKIRPLK